MNFRIGALGVSALAFLVGGCAGGGAPGAVMPQPVADEDLPAWVLALPEGELSRDNNETATAALFLAQGAFDQAIESAQAGMQLDPTNPQSFLQAGQAYLGLGNLEAADEMFDQVEALSPRAVLDVNFFRETEWIEQFNGAVSAMQAGDTGGAVAAFERAHTIYQERPEAMVQLGALYQQDGRLEDALELFTQTVELIDGPVGQREEDPEVIATNEENLFAARFNQGQLLFELERFADAAVVYGQIVEADPDDMMAYSNYGAALVSAGENERASAVYADLLDRPGLTAADYNSIAIGAYNGDLFLQAADAFGRAHEVFPENRDFIFNRAQSLYLAEDQPEQLADAAARLIELDTHNRNAHQFLIQALVRLERQEEAADVLDALEMLPFDIAGLQITLADGGYAVPGVVTNRTAEVGSSADIRFRFYDRDGLEVGSQDISIRLDEAEVGLEFQIDFPTTSEVMGYNYEVLN